VNVVSSAGEGPSPEEVLTAFKVNDVKVALKSGYGKYLRVDKDGTVTGRSDAVGPMEHWEPIFQVRLQGLPCVHSNYNLHLMYGRLRSANRMVVAQPDRKDTGTVGGVILKQILYK